MTESTDELPRCLLRLSQLGATVWRCNTGMGWAGKATQVREHTTVAVHPGDVIVRHARPLRAGLCVGGSDIVGIVPVRITPEMVGKIVGVFVGPEVKDATGQPSPEQLNYMAAVTSLGGISGVVRNENDCDALLAPYEIAR